MICKKVFRDSKYRPWPDNVLMSINHILNGQKKVTCEVEAVRELQTYNNIFMNKQ